MKNIINVDIDTEREQPIKITKPLTFQPDEHEFEEMLKKDSHNLMGAALYLASMLNEDDELRVIEQIRDVINTRYDAIKRDSEES
jgi:hypothetical protein